MYCSKCGAQNRDGGKFCIKYGAPLKKAGEERTAVPTETGSKGAVPAAYGGGKRSPEPEAPRKTAKKKGKKAAIFVAAFLVVALSAGAFAYMNTGARLAERKLDLGEQYLSEQNYEEAVLAFDKVIEIDPKREEAYIGLAEAYAGLGDPEQAEETLEEGLDALPDSEEIASRLAEVQTESVEDGTEGNTPGNLNNGALVAYADGWVYYSRGGATYKMKADGTERTKLSDVLSINMNVVNDWVYYGNPDDNYTIYKMRTDGSETTKLNDEWASYMIVVGDWIYFCNKDDEGAIYKMRTDGSEKTKLNDASHCECLNILNGWIYYRNNNDGGLYKMRTDGSEQTMLNDSTSLCIHGCTTLTGMAQMG